MPSRTFEHLSAIAEAVARATDIPAALDRLSSDLARVLTTRVGVFERTERGWTLVTQSGGCLRASLRDLDGTLSALRPEPRVSVVDLGASGDGVWTSLSIDRPRAPLVVLMAGDWRAIHTTLTTLTMLLSFALGSVSDRSAQERASRILRHGYAVGRRLSRLHDVNAVCDCLVDQVSRALNAERVGLALYRPDEDRLAVVAMRGYPAAVVRDVRIEPGAWVIGHVYRTGRPVIVRNAAQGYASMPEARRYRTASFAAVPVFDGSDILAVLAATDKRDGSAFDDADTLALRTFSASAALALRATLYSAQAKLLAHAAATDMLTGLFNRHHLDVRLREEIERGRRAGTSVALLLLDVDDFKIVNDTRGHQVGDAILQAVGGILKSAVRVFDVCARFGGDELAILMPIANHDRAAASAERIRARVANHVFPVAGVTVSIGVATSRASDAPEDLVQRADQLLYSAKARGKNHVCSSGEGSANDELPVFRDREPA